jgi:DNA-binding response OmpR family regulator
VESEGSILVADDEPFLRKALNRVLSRAGYHVLLAEDGQHAVDIYSEKSEDIVLVILDLNMPVMDGIEAYHKIRGLNPAAKIALSSGETRSHIISRLGTQPDGLLPKPFALAGLLSEIKAIISS